MSNLDDTAAIVRDELERGEYEFYAAQRIRELLSRLDTLEADLAEWKLEAERRGLPIDVAKRLYAAEAQVEALTEPLREIAVDVVLSDDLDEGGQNVALWGVVRRHAAIAKEALVLPRVAAPPVPEEQQ